MKVSVCLITYNHEHFISQALESILQQVTTFQKEIIIGEDCSKDETRKICREYADKYPEIIKLIATEKNVGMMENFTRTYKACTGKYIAFLEGDDYWIDSYKLQKQVDFLEDNADYSACFHNVIIKSERKGQVKEWIMHKELLTDTFVTEDVLGPWFIASPSFVFVNYPNFEIPSWFYNCKYGDLPMMLLLSLRGKFKYIDEVMAVYRLHDNGATTKDLGYDKIILMIFIYESFNVHTKYQFKERIREAIIYEMDRHIPKSSVTDSSGKSRDGFLPSVISKMKTIIKG